MKTSLRTALAEMYTAATRNHGQVQRRTLSRGLIIRMRYIAGELHLLVVRKDKTASKEEYLTVANNLPFPGDLDPASYDVGSYHGYLAVWAPRPILSEAKDRL